MCYTCASVNHEHGFAWVLEDLTETILDISPSPHLT